VIGIDLGWKWDTSAIIPLWRPSSGEPVIVGTPVIVTPPGDGNATEQHRIFDPIKAMAARWRAPTFVIDPNAGGQAMARRDRERAARQHRARGKPTAEGNHI
jgi:hypothetical protein